jgi:poly(3-hydroxybutyrate) depolymerase
VLADEVGAIVVHAEGIIVENSTVDMGGNEESWNAGYCCGDAVAFEIDDVDYLRKVIAKTVEAYPVDENRIYITGWSNGCMMAQRMALQASDLVAAMACTLWLPKHPRFRRLHASPGDGNPRLHR